MSRGLQFALFLTFVTGALGFAHFFLYRHLNQTFQLSTFQKTLLKSLFIFFILSPFIIGFFSLYTIPYLSYVAGLTIFLWFGFLFYYFIFLFSISGFNLITAKLGIFNYNRHHELLTFIPALISILIVLYGLFEARQPQLVTRTIKTSNLTAANFSPSKEKLRIVQISDVHLDLLTSRVFISSLVKKINSLKPDIIVSTGDYLDRGIRCKHMVVEEMQNLKAPLGKYAIFGNHEFYSGTKYAAQITKESGFELLRNRGAKPAPGLVIAGFDDIQGQQMSKAGKIDEKKILKQFDPQDLLIVLRHQPRTEANDLIDLQLSGHTHGGQIFPFEYLLHFRYDYIAGFHQLGTNSYLNVNQGTGTWGPPIRVLTPPEITIIDIVSKLIPDK